MKYSIALLAAFLPALAAADRIAIGLTAAGAPIEAISVPNSGPTVIIIGGLDGQATQIDPPKKFQVLAVSQANPAKARLVFPPTGTAYRENAESHYLWRWIGTTAPDL